MKINLVSLLISIISMVLLAVLIYQIVSYVSPPVTVDGHRYMPTSNILKAVFFSFLFSVVIFFVSRKILKKNT